MIPARRWLPMVLLVGLVGGYVLVGVQHRVDATLAEFASGGQLLYLSSPEWVKRLAMGYDGLLACLYWTRAVQHYGRQHMGTVRQYPLLYPLLDITTTLDPELKIAYRFGAIFLSEPPPHGAGRADQAITLIQKGIRHNPDYWYFWYDLGFLYYRGLKDYPRAAAAFAAGAKNPQAGPWMKVMAARIAAEGGDRRWAMFLWNELYKSTDNPYIRKNARDHIYGLQADFDIEFLEALLARYQRTTGQPAASFEPLVAAGVLRGLPLDPAGFPYRLGADGRVRLDPQSPITTSTRGREP